MYKTLINHLKTYKKTGISTCHKSTHLETLLNIYPRFSKANYVLYILFFFNNPLTDLISTSLYHNNITASLIVISLYPSSYILNDSKLFVKRLHHFI